MSTNPKSIYNEFIRANLPVGITYDEVRAQYVTDNGKRFPTYLQAKWYLDYIIKFGYTPFSIPSLFSGGEQGVWYDPSDLDTLFQDTAGTTPVTTAGQTVALMLDKSQGLTLGPELVTNGTFDSDATGWSDPTNGTILSVSSEAEVTYDSASSVGARQTVSGLTIGRSYELTSTIRVGSNANAADVRVLTQAGSILSLQRVSSDTNVDTKSIFIADGTSQRVDLLIAAQDAFPAVAYFDNISVKELPGYHATQPTAAARPTYQTDGTLHWLSFDGVDDFMVTPTITPGIDKVQVFAGVRKLSDALAGALVSYNTSLVNGSFEVLAPLTAGTYRFGSKGTVERTVLAGGFPAPITNIVTGLGDISGNLAILRIDGTQEAQSAGDQGTGNYLAYSMGVGARAAGAAFFNGNIYSLVTRFGANLETGTIETTETYVAGKTGVTL